MPIRLQFASGIKGILPRLLAGKESALVLLLLAPSLLFTGCERKNEYVPPPPPAVTVAQPLQREAVDYLEFTGTTQSVATVDIKARVQGFLQNVFFKDGAIVKQGELLYIIDPRTYQATVDKAIADLANSKAQLEKAEIEYQRNARLFKENAASDRDVVNSKATRDSAKANVQAAEANLDDAKINLGYTTIYSPLTGRIGRSQVDLGNLVGAGEYTLLTTIKQYDPIYAYFTMNEHQLLRLRKAQRRASGQDLKIEDMQAFLALANDSGFPHRGRLDYADLGVDPTTGTILMRAVFENPPPYVLLPGLFVRLRVPVGKRENALFVSERAFGSDQRGDYLLVVGPENVVEYRPVKIGISVDGMRTVEEGLKPEDLVIISGIQRARPGAKVNPTRVEPAAASPSAQPSKETSGQAKSPAKP